MVGKIITTQQAINVSEKLHTAGKKIILAGGCFDILHIGHITFLEKAKNQGDILFVFVENDETIKKLKGVNRPINTQKDRAEILANLKMVDFVITLPLVTNDHAYDELVTLLEPAIMATAFGDPNRSHKERQAKKIGAKVVDVTTQISNQSTTRLISILNEI